MHGANVLQAKTSRERTRGVDTFFDHDQLAPMDKSTSTRRFGRALGESAWFRQRRITAPNSQRPSASPVIFAKPDRRFRPTTTLLDQFASGRFGSLRIGRHRKGRLPVITASGQDGRQQFILSQPRCAADARVSAALMNSIPSPPALLGGHWVTPALRSPPVHSSGRRPG